MGARGLEQQITEIYAAKKIYAKNLLKDAAEATSLGKEWPEVSPYKEEPALWRESTCMRLPGMMLRKAIKAGGADDWSELVGIGESVKQGFRQSTLPHTRFANRNATPQQLLFIACFFSHIMCPCCLCNPYILQFSGSDITRTQQQVDAHHVTYSTQHNNTPHHTFFPPSAVFMMIHDHWLMANATSKMQARKLTSPDRGR